MGNDHERAVAVVGAGVAGLAAAYSLVDRGHPLDLIERSDRIGGHADTREVGGKHVDVGFMVLNNVTYPNLTEWLTRLGVAIAPSDMSFSVSNSSAEWCSDGFSGMFASWKSLVSSKHWRMLVEMLRFQREVESFLRSPLQTDITLGHFVSSRGFSDYFVHNYLVPVCSSVWSTPGELILESSAECILRFMSNHHMLQLIFRPGWLTVSGRSHQYVHKVQQHIEANGGSVHTSTVVERVQPCDDGVALHFSSGSVQRYKRAVLATHAPDALRMLGNDASPSQRQLLSSFAYSASKLYLHRDARYMPTRRCAWASWNFRSSSAGNDNVCLTYWLNRLQNLGDVPADPKAESKDGDPVLVTLNPQERPRAVLQEWETSHPVPSREANSASKRMCTIQGENCLYFCGAYEGFGFHEDGVKSGFACASAVSDELHPLKSPKATNGFVNGANGHHDDVNAVFKHGSHILKQNPPHMLVMGTHYVARLLCVSFFRSLIRLGRLLLTEVGGDSYAFGDGIDPRGTGPCTVVVRSPTFYRKLALRSDIGFAEAYVAGDIDCRPSIQAVLELAIANRDNADCKSALCTDFAALENVGLPSGLLSKSRALFANSFGLLIERSAGLVTSVVGSTIAYWNQLRKKNTLKQAQRNVSAHYDLSNEMFKFFLDETMTYSCAVFDSKNETLEAAQRRKLKMLADKALVRSGQRVLDIGFGWGSLAILLAKEYECHVTGITLSKEQLELARERVSDAGVQHMVDLKLEDYRTMKAERFDRILCCEMLEAIGHDYLGEFFFHCDRLLNPKGIVAVQVITTPEVRYETYRKSSDFIRVRIQMECFCGSEPFVMLAIRSHGFNISPQEYIFPGAHCPSYHALVDAAAQQSSFTVAHAEDIGGHYAETLLRWRKAFLRNKESLKMLGFGEEFIRTWNYYFQYCAAGFNTRTLGDMQIVFTRTGNCSELGGVTSCCMQDMQV